VVRAVRWPVLDGITAEGIVFEPAARGCVVAVPDADEPPERFGAAQQIAATRFTVVVPALISRADTYSGNPSIRMTNQPHREWVYRMTYRIGRHVIGFEVQKILAAVDWCKATTVWGYGEGGGLALYAAALDDRIKTVGVSGYFGPRESVANEPIYRNVWGLLRDFGDAELAALIALRKVIVDPAPGPVVAAARFAAASGCSTGLAEARGASGHRGRDRPGAGSWSGYRDGTLDRTPSIEIPLQDSDGRQLRAIREIETYCLRLIERSDAERTRVWKRDGPEGVRARLRTELIGELPRDSGSARPRSREIAAGPNWRGYEVV
jgi:hypothetical protein